MYKQGENIQNFIKFVGEKLWFIYLFIYEKKKSKII